MLVDNAAMRLVFSLKQFDVMVAATCSATPVRRASMLTGSIGMLPSTRSAQQGMGELRDGSAPDIVYVDPTRLATIPSAAMMLRLYLSTGRGRCPARIEARRQEGAGPGLSRTGDIYESRARRRRRHPARDGRAPLCSR